MASRKFPTTPNRRQVALNILIAIVATPAALLTHAQQQQGIAFEISLPAAVLPTLRNSQHYGMITLAGDPTSVDPTRGLPLFYIASGLLLLPELARTLLAVYRDFRYGGVVIEAKGEKLIITYDDRLPGDTVVLRDPTGKTTIHKDRSTFDSVKWLELLKASSTKK